MPFNFEIRTMNEGVGQVSMKVGLQDVVAQLVLVDTQRIDVKRHVVVVGRGDVVVRISLLVGVDLEPSATKTRRCQWHNTCKVPIRGQQPSNSVHEQLVPQSAH